MTNSKLLTFALLAFSTLAANDSFAQSDLSAEPFTVLVAGEGEFARCGPSREFYQTDPLRDRQPLQVYMETKDGWLGIKPLSNSFCWIPAEAVKLNQSEQTGTIVEDRTVVWIGTHLERQSDHQWQVKLAEGESVTVIGQSNRQGPDGSQLWFRIVPPSGEYRWVHRDQIAISNEQQDDNSEGSMTNDSADSSLLTPLPKTENREPTLADALKQDGLIALLSFNRRQSSFDHQASPQPQLPSPVGITNIPPLTPAPIQSSAATSATAPNQFANNAAIQASQPIQQASFQTEPQQRLGWQGRPAPLQSELASLPVGNRDLPNGVSADRVAQIESQVQGANVDQLTVLLSQLMANQASAAETQVVMAAARRLASSSPDSTDLAIRLAERAEQYARLAMRREATRLSNPLGPTGSLAVLTPMTNAPIGQVGFEGSPSAGVSPSAAVSASGYLTPVYSVRTDSPPYALTDSLGRTVAYVTQSPGINLRTYINTNVTVSGRQTQHSGLDKPVISADSAIQKN